VEVKMDFWLAAVIIVVTVVTIEAVKDIMKKRAVTNGELSNLRNELSSLQQDIDGIKKDIEEIKTYMADLVIKSVA